MRRLLIFVALLAVAFGTPVANVALNWMLGTYQVIYNPGRPDTYTAISGAGAPRPAWVPSLPWSLIVTAHQVTSGLADGYGSQTIVTTLSLERIRAFYNQELSDRGFRMHDEGIGDLSPAVAALLGVGGTLTGERPADSPEEYKWVAIQILQEGLQVGTRYITVQWRRAKPELLAHRGVGAR